MMQRTVTLEDGFEWGTDGRTIAGRIFPFGEVIHVRERLADGSLDDYDEEFLPGCTTRMRQAAAVKGGPRWIAFTLDHKGDFEREMGFCAGLAEQVDGVHATFRLKDDPMRLDNWRSMLRESHTGLSIEFDDTAPPVVEGRLRRRRQIHIGAVTATPIPAYSGAKILAMRAGDDPLDVGTPNLDRVRGLLATMSTTTALLEAVLPVAVGDV